VYEEEPDDVGFGLTAYSLIGDLIESIINPYDLQGKNIRIRSIKKSIDSFFEERLKPNYVIKNLQRIDKGNKHKYVGKLHVDDMGWKYTFEENAMIKARTICDICHEITVADDSGINVDYLDGEPGVYTARYSEPNATDEKNIQKLLKNLDGVKQENRGATFVSCVACAFPDGRGFVVRGECRGVIATEKHGVGGFGYDPIFYYLPMDMTFAEIPLKDKDRISHRGRAFEAFLEKFKTFI
jgi:XTP/dITP diphosphohydrolase